MKDRAPEGMSGLVYSRHGGGRAVAVVDGREIPIEGYDLSPRGIRDLLGLRDIRFADTAAWGHFGRGFPWG